MSKYQEVSNEALSARSMPHRFISWRQHHAWSALASLHRVAERPLSSLLTIWIMGLAMTLPLLLYLLLMNAQHFGGPLGQNQAINLFLQTNQSSTQANMIAAQLRTRADVRMVMIKTPQQGLEELAKLQGFSGATRTLKNNPLPFLLEVLPKEGLSMAQIMRLEDALHRLPGIDQIQDGNAWRQRFDALTHLVRCIVVMLSVLLALAALLIVGNTVRVEISSRNEEIGVLTLMGASSGFIRRPYLYAGLWYGLFSGMLAVLLVLLIELVLAKPVERLVTTYTGRLHISGLPIWLLITVPFAAGVLGWLGAHLASVWHLRQNAWTR